MSVNSTLAHSALTVCVGNHSIVRWHSKYANSHMTVLEKQSNILNVHIQLWSTALPWAEKYVQIHICFILEQSLLSNNNNLK